jgi:hypothetical protein
MKILFENELLDYTSIVSLYASENYPVTNLLDQFLEKRYQYLTGAVDEITVVLPAEVDINSVFFSYTNATRIDFSLLDDGDVELASHSFTSITNRCHAYHWTSTYGIKKIVVDVYPSTGAYLGGIAAGEVYSAKNPISPWNEPLVDNSVESSSPRGQGLQNYVEPLREYTWTFRDLTREQLNALREKYKAVGIGGKVWIDPFEGDPDFMEPFYAKISNVIETQKNGRRYDVTMTFSESR